MFFLREFLTISLFLPNGVRVEYAANQEKEKMKGIKPMISRLEKSSARYGSLKTSRTRSSRIRRRPAMFNSSAKTLGGQTLQTDEFSAFYIPASQFDMTRCSE